MAKKNLFTTIALLSLLLISCNEKPMQVTDDLAFNDLKKNFGNPGPEWRGKPFWSWNGNLEKDELIRQVNVLKEMGMGGFFMHSRVGLQTEYLGDKWFEMINACADEAAKLGMEAWLYDEDRWPSGIAGGMVTKIPKFRQQFLSCIRIPSEKFIWNDSIIAAYVTDLKDTGFSESKRISGSSESKLPKGKTILVFACEYARPNDFYNGYTYANTMNREATDEYIRLTHEKYKEKSGSRLGTSIKGIFTDEPHRGAVFGTFSNDSKYAPWNVPWTFGFASAFQEKFGYEILDSLPQLFLRDDGGKVNQVKWHYLEMAQELFLKNWEQPYADWCKKNNMIFTGHVLHEDNLMAQSIMQGSLMRFYENMGYPGVDVLTEGNNNYWIVKQAASVARQMNQKFIMSELYGCSGWQMTFENHKATGNWQALFGINLRCQHLSWYTMQGEAKRDYPASIFYQSGWYKDYRYVEDYFSRLGLMLSQGKPVCDVLVINPIESAWSQAFVGWSNGLSGATKEILDLERNYSNLFCWLQGAHIDFDYGDEEMMSRLSRLDQSDSKQPLFYVGQAPYKVIVVGNMTTMRKSTLKLLEDFMGAGGKVIFDGNAPEYVDAVKSPEAMKLSSKGIQVPYQKMAVVEAAKKHIGAVVEVIDPVTGKLPDSIYCQVREDNYRKYVVLMNMNRDSGYTQVLVRIPGKGRVTGWNGATGEPYQIKATKQNGYVEVIADIPPAGEHIFTLSDEKVGDLKENARFEPKEKSVINGPFTYSLNEKNVCVLDMGSYSVNNESFSKPAEILKIDRALRTRFGLKFRGGEMLQPWFASKFEGKPEIKGKVRISFPFTIENLPVDSVFLCMETPELFTIHINGSPVVDRNEGWWIDPAIKKIGIPATLLKEGNNEVLIMVDFSREKNLEALYLIGNFGVKLDGFTSVLCKLPEKLIAGDIVSQGLPFYSGGITYNIPVENGWKGKKTLMLNVPEFEAACVKVSGKSSPEQMIAWQPYRTEISAMANCENEILLNVVLTRRNTFGPLHQLPLRPWAYGPFSFVSEGAAFSENYTLIPSGLLGNLTIEK